MLIVDEPTVTIEVEDMGATIQAFGGERLADLFDVPGVVKDEANPKETSEPLKAKVLSFFMCCRKALCGTCMVEVVDGLQNLSPPTDEELDTMKRLFVNNPKARLACQARVWGDVRLRTFSYSA